MTADRFTELARQGFNRIPVTREVLADLDTPLSVYLKLAEGPYSYLFESVQGGEKWGRYSIIGLPARTVVRVHGHEVSVEENGRVVERAEVADPLAWVEAFHGRFKVVEQPGMPRFNGGLVGYFGYDTIRYIEPRLARAEKPDAIGTPDILLMVSDEVLVFDNLAGKLFVIVLADPATPDALENANARLDALVRRLHGTTPRRVPTRAAKVSETDFVSGFTQQGFENAVERTRRYIIDGDIMQVVLSQRLSIPFQARPLDLYRALRSINPSPYMYYLDLEGFHVVGSSPEILVRLEDGMVTVRPIAGTRKRGASEAEDLA
ncbi:MAG: chorismate-binding protein, partial [Hydrogenophaga sp.]